MTDTADINLWMDTVCATAVAFRAPRIVTERPPTTVTSQRCWHDNFELRVRYALKYMPPESRIVIEGVSVRRYSGDFGHVLYYAVNDVKQADFEAAVKAVCEKVTEGEL